MQLGFHYIIFQNLRNDIGYLAARTQIAATLPACLNRISRSSTVKIPKGKVKMIYISNMPDFKMTREKIARESPKTAPFVDEDLSLGGIL